MKRCELWGRKGAEVIRTRGDMIGYLVAHHDCTDGEAVCERLCHGDNVRVSVDRVGGVGPHCSGTEETALGGIRLSK